MSNKGIKVPPKHALYVVIKRNITPGHAALACAHAGAAVVYKFGNTEDMRIWQSTSFRKRIVTADETEWAAIKTKLQELEIGHQVMTESSLGNAETCIITTPRREWFDEIKALPLYT